MKKKEKGGNLAILRNINKNIIWIFELKLLIIKLGVNFKYKKIIWILKRMRKYKVKYNSQIKFLNKIKNNIHLVWLIDEKVIIILMLFIKLIILNIEK